MASNEKGLITQAEFMQKLSAERAVYQAMLRKMRWSQELKSTHCLLGYSLTVRRNRMKSRKTFWIAVFLIAVLGLAGCMHSVTQREGGGGSSQGSGY